MTPPSDDQQVRLRADRRAARAAEQRARRQRLLRIISTLAGVIISAVGAVIQPIYQKEPYHTSKLTGQDWVLELLLGHPKRIRCELGIHRHVFTALITGLQDMGHTNSKHVTLEEQLAIYLYCCVTGLALRHVGERFQRSSDTISRYFKKIMFIFSSPPFYTQYVHLPVASDPTPSQIRKNPKFWPFFDGAIGAIDGSHIPCSCPARERAVFRNRKGFVSQNCLFTCSFDFKFIYSYTGWEGSATDARIYEAAQAEGLVIPAGKYFLADAGFPARDGLLTPYRGVRYHLAEWGRANLRPRTKEELFNLRHSSARNVIERIFGVLKQRFRILLLPPAFGLDIQARIPASLSALHNFIRVWDPDEGSLPEDAEDDLHSFANAQGDINEGGIDEQKGSDRRDQIALAMWEDYQRVCQDRGIDGDNLLDDLSDDEYDTMSDFLQ